MGAENEARSVVFPLFLAVQEKVIPVGMKDLVISLQDLEKPYDGGNLLMLALSPKGDGARAPEGKRVAHRRKPDPVGRRIMNNGIPPPWMNTGRL